MSFNRYILSALPQNAQQAAVVRSAEHCKENINENVMITQLTAAVEKSIEIKLNSDNDRGTGASALVGVYCKS